MKCKDHPDEDVVLISFKGNNEFDFLCLKCDEETLLNKKDKNQKLNLT